MPGESQKKRIHRCAFPLICHGKSDVGLVRKNNEDVFVNLKEYSFFALADGMGGHNAGEVAAQEAVSFVSTSIEELFDSEEQDWNIFDLSDFSRLCIENANSHVHYLGRRKKGCTGMGTTLCTLLFHERSLVYAHVGDSRIYRFRQGALDPLTSDHSLCNDIMKRKKLTKEVSKILPYKNILTRAIGTQVEVEPEIHIAPVKSDDIYLMCSDGLTNHVSDQKILHILRDAASLKEGTEALIESAKKGGGRDNVTVVLVKTEEPHGSKPLL